MFGPTAATRTELTAFSYAWLLLLNPARGAGNAHDEEDHVRSTASR